MVACVFAAVWVRSLHSRLFIFVELGKPIDGRINVYCSANQMDILLQQNTRWDFAFGERQLNATSNALNDFWFFDVQNIDEEIVDDVQQVAPGYEVRVYFYVIVLPLTLVSLWLLLSKPRPHNSKSPFKPISEAMRC